MEIRHLRYFVAVAEERHFGRAADRLRMAQPPLSQQIKQLEEELGTLLLERTTRRVDLTPAGTLLLERARVLLSELDTTVQDVKEVGLGAAGVIRLGSTGSAAERVSELVARARQDLPALRITVQGEMLTPDLERALEEHRIDLALLRPPVRSPRVASTLLARDELVVAVPPDSAWADRSALDLAELAEAKFVSYPMSSAVTTIAFEACHQAGFRPTIVQEVAETSTLLAFVAAGVGVALVPSGRHSTLGPVHLIPLRSAPVVDLAVAWVDDPTPLARSVIDLLLDPSSEERNT